MIGICPYIYNLDRLHHQLKKVNDLIRYTLGSTNELTAHEIVNVILHFIQSFASHNKLPLTSNILFRSQFVMINVKPLVCHDWFSHNNQSFIILQKTF